MKLFLESWNILDTRDQSRESYYIPLLDDMSFDRVQETARRLRADDHNVTI